MKFLSIVDVIESVLDIPFKSKELNSFNLSSALLQKLSFVLSDYYQNLKIPKKKISELRPFISPTFQTGRDLSLKYVFSQENFKEPFKFEFIDTISGKMTKEIKK